MNWKESFDILTRFVSPDIARIILYKCFNNEQEKYLNKKCKLPQKFLYFQYNILENYRQNIYHDYFYYNFCRPYIKNLSFYYGYNSLMDKFRNRPCSIYETSYFQWCEKKELLRYAKMVSNKRNPYANSQFKIFALNHSRDYDADESEDSI